MTPVIVGNLLSPAVLFCLLGMFVAGATLFAVLAASASYIVVPAAMRVAVPEANTGIGTSLSMGVTFPFNIVLGIPLYYAMATLLAAG